MLKKIISFLTMISLIVSISGPIFTVNAVETNGVANMWTLQKAEHLARKGLIGATNDKINELYIAGSAENAVDILFPSKLGPDRDNYNPELNSIISDIDFNPENSNNMYEYYMAKKLLDPYEAKIKLFQIIEDIFSVFKHNGKDITYTDIENTHELLYSHTLGNYKEMIKRNLYNNGNTGDYSLGKFLDLFNQKNPQNPNENYGRELLQLFLMLEYIPTESEDRLDKRNYTEDDVESISKILVGFESDENTHEITFNNDINTNAFISFLDGPLKNGDNFPFYNSGSGIIDIEKLKISINGNNGLPDNTIDYIFSKREYSIAMFLADKLYRFYVAENPEKYDLNILANKIIEYDFELYPSVKWLLASDMMYSDKSINSIIYKNPIELSIGTAKLLGIPKEDLRTSTLYNLDWSPYYPPNIFGRNGFDDNSAFFTSYIANKWVSESSHFARYLNTDSFVQKEVILTNFNGVGKIFDNYSYYNNKTSLDIITNTGNTLTGSLNFTSIVLIDENNQNINISNGTMDFTDLSINTSIGKIKFNSGSLNFVNNNVILNSGILDNNGVITNLNSGTIDIDGVYSIIEKMTPEYLISSLEKKLYMGRELSNEVKNKLIQFLIKDKDGNDIIFDLKNITYNNYYTRGLIHLMLIQPEYILQTGYDINNITEGNIEAFYTNNSKLVLIKAGGGLDYLHGIIQKDEYSEYLDKRGTGAITGTGLLDLDDNYYINSNLNEFKKLYDSGNLRLINRVGTPDHSRGHDSASRKLTSLNNIYDIDDDGIVGHFIKNEEASKTVVLGTYKPFIFRGGKYLNIGSNALYGINDLTNTDFRNYKIGLIKNLLNTRKYPGNISSVFKNSVTINDVANNSKSNGGRSGAGGNMEDNFIFLESLLDSNISNITRMGADGGYDTHGKQKDYLNGNFKKVADRTSAFFNRVKNKQDITILLYSEFGRTLKSNASLGTDHGKAGGMFILSNNIQLLNNLDKKIYGNNSIKDAKGNWLGVGVDYRAVYSTIFESLYGKDISSEVGGIYNIDDYIDINGPKVDLFRIETKEASNGSTRSNIRLIAKIDDKNFLPSQASYVRLEYGTDINNMREESVNVIDSFMITEKDNINLYIKNLNPGLKYYYRITLYDNQYNKTIIDGEFSTPEVKGSMDDILLTDTSTRLRKYNKLTVSGSLDITNNTSSGIVLSSTGNTLYNGKDNLLLQAFDKTFITNLETSTGGIWNGVFLLPEFVNKDIFIGKDAKYGEKYVETFKIEKLIKVGADTLGLGMNLNKKVQIEVPDINTSKKYLILSSSDGIIWTKIETPEIQKMGNKLTFKTDHFSYFAITESGIDGEPLIDIIVDDSIGENGNNNYNTSGGSGWGGGYSKKVKDKCEFGDYTSSYYDNDCGEDPDKELSMQGIDMTEEYMKNNNLSKIEIEQDKISTMYINQGESNNDIDILNDTDELIKLLSSKLYTKEISGYNITQINGNKLNSTIEKVVNLIIKKNFYKKDTDKLIKNLNDFMLYNGVYNLEGINKDIKIKSKDLLKKVIRELKANFKVAIYNKKTRKPTQNSMMKESIARIKREEDEKINEKIESEDEKEILGGEYIYKINSNIIDLRTDPYWKSINARLYKGDIVEQITGIHRQQFFKVRIIKSKSGYEGVEGYIFVKHLVK